MKIKLSRTRPDYADLKKSHLISFHADYFCVEIPEDHRYYWRELQKAGRQCDQMGLSEVELSGHWSLEEQWAFYQGYTRPLHAGQIHFAPLPS